MGVMLCANPIILTRCLISFKDLDIKEANTSHDSSLKLTQNSRRAIGQLEYASAISCLMHAMHCTRPYIVHAICKLSRYTSNPSTAHWDGITRILRYLKKYKNLGPFYGNFPTVLEGCIDASWITSLNDDKATTDGFSYWIEGLFLGHQRNRHA